MSGYAPTLAVALLSLALAMTALWLVTDMVKRMVTEAKALVDASTKALWRQHATTEKTVKAAVDNQRTMADEIARLRQKLDERERRERDLTGRLNALSSELERQTARILGLMNAAEQARQPVIPARPSASAIRPRSAQPGNLLNVTPPAASPPANVAAGGEGGGLARWLSDVEDPKTTPTHPATTQAASQPAKTTSR